MGFFRDFLGFGFGVVLFGLAIQYKELLFEMEVQFVILLGFSFVCFILSNRK